MEPLHPPDAGVRDRALGQLLDPLPSHTRTVRDLLGSQDTAPATVDLGEHLAGVGEEVFLFHSAKIRVDS